MGPPAHVVVSGALAKPGVDVGGGLHLTGAVTLRYATGGCKQLAVEGTLARASAYRGLHFTAGTAIASGEFTQGGEPILRGTLSQAEIVDGITFKGVLMVRVTSAGELHLIDGTLAKAAPFEAWQLPVGTHVQRFGAGWSFTVPRNRTARAMSDHLGEHVDFVTEAHFVDPTTTFTLSRPHSPKGTKLSLQSIGIEHGTGCILGDLAVAQRFGIFTIPKGGNATVCAGVLVAAEGNYAVTSLQVGSWFATSALVGDPTSPPRENRRFVPRSSSSAPTGYWIQINSLCQGRSGIPQPPPTERWIWVDLKGAAVSAPDRKELSTRAAHAGAACPVTPCCPP